MGVGPPYTATAPRRRRLKTGQFRRVVAMASSSPVADSAEGQDRGAAGYFAGDGGEGSGLVGSAGVCAAAGCDVVFTFGGSGAAAARRGTVDAGECPSSKVAAG
jgi:hypothetical protein